MPASLYQSNLNMERIPSSDLEDNRAVKLAYELAMLGLDNSSSLDSLTPHTLAQLEELKTRKSQNMTECVPVPTSEHVAEIVGRQGNIFFLNRKKNQINGLQGRLELMLRFRTVILFWTVFFRTMFWGQNL